MLTKRIIPCLDVRAGRVTKGVKFENNVDLGDPVDMAVAYSDGGADELVFYDITASAEGRPIDIGMVEAVAKAVRIPFAVGGGISCISDMERVILAGAEKISVNSLAVKNPQIIADGERTGSIPKTTHWRPNAAAPSAMSDGRSTASELTETFSAPARITRSMSPSVATPPPTAKGMRTARATASTMPMSIGRPSADAVMS